MTNPIIGLAKDIKSRWIRAVCVVLLAFAVIALSVAEYSWWEGIVSMLCITIILGIIGTDTTRGLHHSKAALYSTAVAVGLWVAVLIDTLLYPPRTLFAFSTSGDNAFSLEIAPITLITVLLLLLAASGSIAYSIGKKRGDVRGTKKQKIFK